MELQVSHEEDYVLAATVGRTDDSADELFREGLHPLVGQRGTKVVLDLAQSNFITSRGIGVLVSLVVHANTNGSRVIMAACSPFIAAVFETTKLNTFFQVAPTVSEAVSRLSA